MSVFTESCSGKYVVNGREREVKDLDNSEGKEQFIFLEGYLHGHFIMNDTMTLAEWNRAVDEAKRFQAMMKEITDRVQGK